MVFSRQSYNLKLLSPLRFSIILLFLQPENNHKSPFSISTFSPPVLSEGVLSLILSALQLFSVF